MMFYQSFSAASEKVLLPKTGLLLLKPQMKMKSVKLSKS